MLAVYRFLTWLVQMVLPITTPGGISVQGFAELCYATRGLSGVALAWLLGALADAGETPAHVGGRTRLALAIGAGTACFVASALHDKVSSFPEVAAVARVRTLLSAGKSVEELSEVVASIRLDAGHMSDFALLVCLALHRVFFLAPRAVAVSHVISYGCTTAYDRGLPVAVYRTL